MSGNNTLFVLVESGSNSWMYEAVDECLGKWEARAIGRDLNGRCQMYSVCSQLNMKYKQTDMSFKRIHQV